MYCGSIGNVAPVIIAELLGNEKRWLRTVFIRSPASGRQSLSVAKVARRLANAIALEQWSLLRNRSKVGRWADLTERDHTDDTGS
jgi:hypothetical protein